MFHRIIHESWHDWVPVVAFILTFTVFVIAFVRALLAREATVQHMAALPLDLPPELHDPSSVSPPSCSSTCRRCPACHRDQEPQTRF